MTATIGAVKNAGNIDDLSKIIDCLDDFGDVSIVLREAGIDRALAQSALEASKFANELDNVVDSSTGLKKIDTALDGLDDGTDFVDNLGDAFKGAGQKIGNFFKTAGPILLFAAAVAGTAIAIKNYYEKFDKLVETAETSQGAYSDAAAEIKNLQSEIDATTAKIAEFEAQGELTITEQGELERLRSQNLELERQKKLKEEIAGQQSQQATDDAMEALSLERTQDISQKNRISGSGRHDFVDQTDYVQTDVVTATKNEIAALEKLKIERKKLLEDGVDDKKQTELFSSLDSEIKKYESEISTNLESISSLRNNFIDQSTGLLKENLTEEQKELFYSMTKIIDDFNNIDLTGAEKEFSKLESFFDGSSGRNAIKEKLLDSSSSTRELEEELSRLGLTLDDIGIGNIGFLYDYLKDIKEAAKEATDSVQDYSTSVSDIEAASESADQDKNWSTISEAYKEAKELLKEGKTGTDNFQTMASFLNPAKVKELAEEGGKYTADAYQKAFEEVKKTANRWFGEDETKSMENFVNDFKKEGLFDVETDEMGLWDIETNFKTTAEAADEFGISIEAVETMLEALGAYGYDFGDVMFSGDAISEYESHLENIRNMSKNLDDSSFKDKLEAIIDDADTKDFENRIEELTPEIVADIKFEYDLAQIDLEIQKLRDRLSYAGYEDTSANAELMASNDYRSETWRAENTGIKKDSGYMALDDTISNMRKNLNGKSGEELANLQKQVMAAQELRTAFENAFDIAELNGEKIDWESYINSNEANQTLSSIAEDFNLTEEELEKIFGKDFDFNVDTSDAEAKIANIISTSTGKQIIMSVDATTEQIEEQINDLENGDSILFTAEVDGESLDVLAEKNLNGEITYKTVLADGSTQWLTATQNKDGTVTYTPITTEVDSTNYDQNGNVHYKGIFPDKAPTIKGTIEYVGKIINNIGANLSQGRATRISTGDSPSVFKRYGTVLSPAHKDGTAYNVLNTLPISAYASGKVGLDRNQQAIVNEEYINGHSESIVRDGVWRLIPGGAHVENLKKGDMIFSAQQTEDLLRSGRTSGHARAYAQGTVLANAYRLGDSSKKSTKSKTSKRDIVDTTDKTTKQLEKALKKIGTYFDWIKILFERLAQNSENAKDKIERAGKLSGKYGKLAKTNEAIETVQKERKGVQAGRDEYKKKAKSVARQVGLDKYLQKRVQDGTIKISEYGENTQNKINAYKEWWDKYEEANNKLLDLKDEELELALSRFDLIQEWYDAEQDIHDSMIERNQSKLDLREAKGYSATSKGAEKLLRSNLNQAKNKKTDAVSERNKYQAEIKRQLENETLKKGTLKYKEAQAELNRLNAAVNEASIEVINHADALREIKYEKLNNAIAKFERAVEKIQNKIDLSEARDENVSEATYRNQISQNNKIIDKKYALRNDKLKEQSKYAVNSKRYQELADEISGYENEIYGLLTENENIKDNIFESRFAPLEEGVEALQNVRSELDDFRSLFNEEAFFDSKTGALTGEGVANIYLIEEAMISAKQEIANHSKGLDKLEENYKNGVISQEEFNEKSEEYRQGIRNATSNVKEYSDALVDLYLTQMEKENELLQKTISLRKEALQKKAAYYDYDKNIRNQSKDINALKAQAAALEMSNDASSKAELKRLRQEIADAEEELSETKRSHSIEMQEQGYDALSQDLNDVLADTELEIKSNADKQLEIIDSMLQQTVSKYAEAYKSINKIINETGFEGSKDFNKTVNGIKTEEKADAQVDKALKAQGKVSAENDVKDIKTGKIKEEKDYGKMEKNLSQPEKTTNREVASIELSKSSVSIEDGKSKKVTATVRPTDAKNRKLRWQSSNTKIATVSNGVIKAKKAGNCTITAIAADGSGTKASVKVTVTAKSKAKKKNNQKTSNTPKDNGNKTQSPKTSSGDNGKITKGEKVIFASGRYTAASDGSGASGKANLGKSVYVQKIKSGAKRPYLITKDKAGKHGLGWVSKSQLKGYASGTKGTTQDEWARIYEKGNEIVTLPDGSVLTKLPKGTGVIPNNLTDNLWGLARSYDDIMENSVGNSMKYINNVVNNGGNNITYHYGSLLTVNGDVDKEALPSLKEIIRKSCDFTIKEIARDARKVGIKI